MKLTKMSVHTTFGAGDWNQQFHQTVAFTDSRGTENKVVNLYPDITDQTFEGFGGAFNESAAYVYSLMPEKEKRALLETYFGKDGMNYQFVRVHMDSCDFSLGQYEAMSDPGDVELKSFSMERNEKYIIPMLLDAEKVAGRKLRLMLSPWSPPAFMKTNGKREKGGKLKPEYRAMWAEYLCRYIEAYRKRGFIVQRISLQNEPHAMQAWDSCIYSAEDEKVFLRDYLYPAMQRHGLTGIEVFIWDHNKERVYERMRDTIDANTDSMIAGAAFHWYSGDHFDALDLCRRFFPDKKLIVSESCIEFYKFDPKNAAGAAICMAHEILGDLNHGMNAFYDWSVLLDERGGPNYVDNFCLAPFLYDTQTKKLKQQLIGQYIAHFCEAAMPGSVHVPHSSYSDQVEATAWKRPDGTIAIVLLNRSMENQPVVVRMCDREAGVLLYPESITTSIVE